MTDEHRLGRATKDWQQITVDLPIKGQPQIVRLYLPAQESPVEIQSVRFSGDDGREQVWDFSKLIRDVDSF